MSINIYDPPIKLINSKAFHIMNQYGNEMLATEEGTRMFPAFVMETELPKDYSYTFSVQFEKVSPFFWRYEGAKWVPGKRISEQPKTEEFMYERGWLSADQLRIMDLKDIKISFKPSDSPSTFCLIPNVHYQPIVTIYQKINDMPIAVIRCDFAETRFIAVEKIMNKDVKDAVENYQMDPRFRNLLPSGFCTPSYLNLIY